MYIKVGQTWASMFEFFEAYLTPDAYADCAVISVTDGTADPPATASSSKGEDPQRSDSTIAGLYLRERFRTDGA